MKFLLTSGGITNDSIAKALFDLAGKPVSELSVAFVPTAANPVEGDKGWLIGNYNEFQKQGFGSFDIVDIAALEAKVWKERLLAADIICFGGGNEQYLAKLFADLGMKEFLMANLEGKVYVGISAGSMVVGELMPFELMETVYPEESFENVGGKGMGFFDFFFIPHLNSPWFTHVTKETLESVKDKMNGPVYAFDEEAALKIDGDMLEIVGTGNSLKLNQG